MQFSQLMTEITESVKRRGFLDGYAPHEDADPLVIAQALRWAGEVGEFTQRLAKDGGKDRGRLAAEWADAMIVGLVVGALLRFSEADILEKARLDERRGYRHQGTPDDGEIPLSDAIRTVMGVARKYRSEGHEQGEAL